MNQVTMFGCILLISIAIVPSDAFIKSMNILKPQALSTTPNIDYKEKYFSVPVDHFGYANEDRFQLRYLINDAYYGGDGAPVFFYAGNEGDIAWFCNNTGLMWSWAPEFKALVIFVEHRYYGKSLPYGKDSYKDKSRLGYLSSEQALADFADVLMGLRDSGVIGAQSPVIAFGGSYGGMLAAWMRMKYPHVVEGALAASAPILWFGNLTHCGAFSEVVTADFAKSGPHCVDNVKASWKVIDDKAQTAEGRLELKSSLRLCDDLTSATDARRIKDWLTETYGNLAMVDYPYAASFLEPLPAWPIKAVCEPLDIQAPDDSTLLSRLGQAVNVYYNYTGGAKCFNLSQQATSDLGDLGWNFQACTEMVMPMCSKGGTADMFEPQDWDEAGFAAGCKQQFGITTRPEWAIKEYGGDDLTAHSNIIFSNGALDPWSGGGVLVSPSASLPAIVIADGAHHLDLRSPRSDDPESVTAARAQERKIIEGWIQGYGKKQMEVSYLSSFTAYILEVVPDSNAASTSWLETNSVMIVAIGTLTVLALVLVVLLATKRRASNHSHHAPLPVRYLRREEEKTPLL